jgi:AcrR family transcriptional regulator
VYRQWVAEETLVWDRPEPPQRPTPTPLSRDLILRAALRLADTAGLAEVSLRKVAAELNAGPMRLYGYIATKDELLDLMLDAVYAEIPLVPADLPWRAALRTIAHGTRTAARRHEWFADLLGSRLNFGPHTMVYLESVLASVYGQPGFTHIDAVMRAVYTVNAYVAGAVRLDIANLRAERAGRTVAEWQRASGAYMSRQVATGKFPTMAAVMADATHPDPDTKFDDGLTYILDGIATHHALG